MISMFVCRHPYFWPDKHRYEFLLSVGQELSEDACCTPPKTTVSEKINNIGLQTIPRDWVSVNCSILCKCAYSMAVRNV